MQKSSIEHELCMVSVILSDVNFAKASEVANPLLKGLDGWFILVSCSAIGVLLPLVALLGWQGLWR